MRDGWLLAVGTLTALPVPPPRRVDRSTARVAVLVAPLAVLPLALGVVLVGALGVAAETPPLVLAVLVVGLLALGTRAMHWDGLSDTVDGLSASYDAHRSLEVMKSGTSGPAGVLATVLVAGLQVAALSSMLHSIRGAFLAGALVCVSRGALAVTCARGVPPARRDGLGQPLAEVSSPIATATLWSLCLVLVSVAFAWAGLPWWHGVLACLATLVVLALLVQRTVRRFGGVTGDVYGTAIELALATLLVAVVV
ncbi:adenosylcobinamide-GDP ribazoletransferase [Nocardioides campestrisoli]|uniref:adenosylcobinamide-GDP ribazoletransferase n=1 Tax=Nocardioides campestrisoli TaxID=2736757 RepID=UPI00163DAC60|nr:adenosylcobinamide-GDP ribazoletransferase [Nocardioides campestrisoli]